MSAPARGRFGGRIETEPEETGVARAEGGVRIAWRAYGEGQPVVLVMGFMGSGHAWFRLLPHIAAGRRAILLDNRGTGDSDRPLGLWSMDDLAADVLAVLDDAGLERAHVITPRAPATQAPSGTPRSSPCAPPTRRPCPPRRPSSRPSLATTRARAWGACRCRLLVLHGDEDQLVPPAAGRQLAALIPGAQFELLPACGHVLTTDCEQEAAGAIGAFLDRVEA